MTRDSTPSAAATASPPVSDAGALVLFDGVCNFCNGAVNFIIDRDPDAYFKFAPLQSPLGRSLREQFGVEPHTDAFILVENGRTHLASSAALRIARRLVGLWPCLYALVLIPRPLRDALYAWFARRRYWFGRSEQCRVPTPETRARFVATASDEDSTG